MAPDPVANPEETFVVTRLLPNGRENTIDTFDWGDGTLSQEQAVRQVVEEFVREQRTNNPAWVILVYGPTNGGPHTDDDRIWDSRLFPL